MRTSRCHRSRAGACRAVAAVVLLVAASAGCGDDDVAGEGAASGDVTVTRGAALYEQTCASCHGSDLRGTDQGPSHLSIVYEPGHHPDASFRAAITNGVRAHHWDFGDMPPIEGLDDDEIDAIIEFVRQQQEEHGFEPYPPD